MDEIQRNFGQSGSDSVRCLRGGISVQLTAGERIYYSVLNVLLAVGIYSMLQQTEQNLRKIEEKRDRKRKICYVAVISFLFALSMVMGYQRRIWE